MTLANQFQQATQFEAAGQTDAAAQVYQKLLKLSPPHKGALSVAAKKNPIFKWQQVPCPKGYWRISSAISVRQPVKKFQRVLAAITVE